MGEAELHPGARFHEETRAWAEEWLNRWSRVARDMIHSHPFMKKVERGQVSPEGVRGFTENWYHWARTMGMSGASLYHRHLPVFKLYPDLDSHVLDRIAQELVQPLKGGHARALERLFPVLGIDPGRKSMPRLLPEMRGFIAFVRRLHMEGTFAEVHSCQYGPNIAPFARAWADALATHYGVPQQANLYWEEYRHFDERRSGGGILGTRQQHLFLLTRIKELGLTEKRPGWGMEYAAEISLGMWELFLNGCEKAFE
jgi:pyrroloquinoline quinone (PQQ) biosynthesis protein C